jgi:hypothetical protein
MTGYADFTDLKFKKSSGKTGYLLKVTLVGFTEGIGAISRKIIVQSYRNRLQTKVVCASDLQPNSPVTSIISSKLAEKFNKLNIWFIVQLASHATDQASQSLQNRVGCAGVKEGIDTAVAVCMRHGVMVNVQLHSHSHEASHLSQSDEHEVEPPAKRTRMDTAANFLVPLLPQSNQDTQSNELDINWFISDFEQDDTLGDQISTDKTSSFDSVTAFEPRYRKFSTPTRLCATVDNSEQWRHALHAAVYTGRVDICAKVIAYMIAHNIDVNHASHKLTALMLACVLGHDSIVTFLASHERINPNTTVQDQGWTALHFAVVHRKPQCVKALLKSGRVDLHARAGTEGKFGMTALMLAIVNGDEECTQALLPHAEYQADGNGPDDDGDDDGSCGGVSDECEENGPIEAQIEANDKSK